MYKQVVILSLLAAAATTFPSSGVDDLGTTRPLKGADSIQEGQELQTGHKSLIQIEGSSGNPVELIEESVNSTARPRNARNCIASIAFDCSDKGANLTETYADDQEKLSKALASMADYRNKIFDTLRVSLDRILPPSSSGQNSNSVRQF